MTSRVLVRALTATLAGSLCGAAAVGAVVLLAGDATPADAGAGVHAAAGPVGAASEPRDVLRRWDAARAAAWASGDRAALSALYTPGSVAGRRDVAMLDAWSRRGLRVTSMATQVLELRVLVEQERRLVLRVTDRLVGAAAGAVSLPRDEVSTRVVELRRDDEATWRVAAVSDRRAPSRRRPRRRRRRRRSPRRAARPGAR